MDGTAQARELGRALTSSTSRQVKVTDVNAKQEVLGHWFCGGWMASPIRSSIGSADNCNAAIASGLWDRKPLETRGERE